ncbi:MAG TPA: hypothetical protein VJN01_02975, partial [Xanthomonadales bacterium]|nr:hypothetical protein [Xanthomonadales bacterium]
VTTTNPYPALAEDVASPESLVLAVYDAISAPRGERDWNRIRSFYLEGARLIPTGLRANGEHGLRIMNIEQWIEGARDLFLREDFFEVEIARKVDRFGQIAQIFSTYECRREANGPAYMTGINSFQLLHKDGRWWVVNCFWDNASEGNPIPPQYL